MKIYFAGPLFTTAERQFNKAFSARLEAAGYEVFLPQERGPVDAASAGGGSDHRARSMSPAEILGKNLRDLDAADLVVAIMDGPDPDSGTAWECGYAYALKKPTVLLRTDLRAVGDLGMIPYNAMLTGSADAHIEIPLATIDEAADAILAALDRLAARQPA